MEKAKCDYEAVRNARMSENKARFESLGLLNTLSQLREAQSEAKMKKTRQYQKRVYGLTPLRRSHRLNPAANGEKKTIRSQSGEKCDYEEAVKESAKCDYEALRKARMEENQARLESLGLLNSLSQLRQVQSEAKMMKKPRQCQKRVYGLTPPRRSQRLNAAADQVLAVKDPTLPLSVSTTKMKKNPPPPRRSLHCSKTPNFSSPKPKKVTTLSCKEEEDEKEEEEEEEEEEEKRPANAPFVQLREADILQISPECSARRCNSKGRGTIYNPVLGICCHFCRQKKLCGEEDCKRCGNFDVNEPCLGKTDCSVCHSSNGVLCRGCLKVRYGVEIEEVRKNKGWMCPHCIEEKGINPYWICNSSICLRKRKMDPTGLAIYKAREMRYESVAHLLMDQLKRGKKHKR